MNLIYIKKKKRKKRERIRSLFVWLVLIELNRIQIDLGVNESDEHGEIDV